MAARDDILALEIADLEKRYDFAIRRLRDMVLSPHYGVTDLICKLLTALDLAGPAGALNRNGYPQVLTDSLLGRVEFVVFFVGHEILDDGEPALMWHRNAWADSDADDPFVDCDKSDREAQPYWHRYRDITAERWEDRAPALTAELAIWTIDWHDARERERWCFLREDQPFDNEPEPAPHPILVDLAAELRALESEDA